MKNLVKITAIVPELKLGNIEFNKQAIIEKVNTIDSDIYVFPELTLTGYSYQDLFFQNKTDKNIQTALLDIAKISNNKLVVIGAPVKIKNKLYNCAVFMNNKKIVGIVPKTYIPNYNEFYENRWFSSGKNISTKIDIDGIVPVGTNIILKNKYDELCIGAEICEDLWTPEPPSGKLAKAGANVILNLSASNEIIGKHEYRKLLVTSQSGRTITTYIYTSAGTYESTSDLIFTGETIIAENGKVIKEMNQINNKEVVCSHVVDIEKITHDRVKMTTFENDFDIEVIPIELQCNRKPEHVNPYPFVPHGEELKNRCKEIITLQSLGLEKRLKSTKIKNMVIGISGGLDSTLALLVCKNVVDRMQLDTKNIIGITMPCFSTSERTLNNSKKLMKELEITGLEIQIGNTVLSHLKDIGHPETLYDIGYENAQARERTQILFDVANDMNGLVIGTGDLSELALGWCTYNGDHMSNYAINVGVPKTLVKFLVKTYADEFATEELKNILYDILDTPISPELVPMDDKGKMQETETKIGKYDIHDFCLYHFIRNGFDKEKITELALIAFDNQDEVVKTIDTFFTRFKTQQFKRNCVPDGPKIGSVSLSPRGDWRMPSDL